MSSLVFVASGVQAATLTGMHSRGLLAALLLWATMLPGQSFTPVREQKNLSPAALATLHTLESLNALPSGAWKMHLGDLPHGESVTLDDSSWATVTAPAKASRTAVWYRREIEVPKTLNGYDVSGSRIWFQFQADANGPMPEIIYFNGRRVALGDDLEPIVLFEPALAGEKILVAVKLLQTVDEKRFRGATFRIEPIMGEQGSHLRPNADDLRVQCVAAANLLPSLPVPRPDLLPTVEKAVAEIDLKALQAGNQALFDASLLRAQATLATLHDVLAQAKVTLAGNAHIDAAWLWPRSETIDVVRRTFTTALQLMNEYPDYTFTQSAAQYSEWMADKYPDLNKQIQQRIREGRWEIVGGMWVEPDLNLPDGESLVRQLLVGQRYFSKEYGVTARIGWNPDSFGYNWQLPQIYKRSGLDYFVTQKMHWNDTNILPFRLFWWESPDGSKILTYFPTDYVHDNVNPTRISADFAETAQRNPGTTELMDLYGIGDHGGGPTRNMLEQADHWIATGKQPSAAVPQMHFGTAQQFFSRIEKTISPVSREWNYGSIAKGYQAPVTAPGAVGLPTWKDELYFEYHRGVFTTQAKHKRDNRRSETQTLDAEKLASMAWLQGRPYPADELTESWKKITFNQFHDLAAGSGIAVIYRDAEKDYTEVFRSDREIAAASLETLSAAIDTRVPGNAPILIVNSLAWPRTETMQIKVPLTEENRNIQLLDAQERLVPTQTLSRDLLNHQTTMLAQVSVPALGYTVLHAVSDTSGVHDKNVKQQLTLTSTSGSFILTNAHLRLSIDRKSGCISSLASVPQGKEFLASGSCGNELQTFVDTPHDYDAWNIDPGTLDHHSSISNLDEATVSNDGPLRKTIHLERTWQKSTFVQDISLDADADMVDVANRIDWHETHVLLKAAFQLAATSEKATYEIPFGSIDRSTLRTNTWEKAQFEVPALRWADLGDEHEGFSLLNDSKYGYDAEGHTLRLTLLRSPTWPDPEADRGLQEFHYALYPHSGRWTQALTVRHGYEVNDPLTATMTTIHPGSMPPHNSFGSVENANVTLTAMKKAEDADALIFRMYEWAGEPATVRLHVPTGAISAIETNLMEKTEGVVVNLQDNVVSIPIKAFEILTIQVAYPPGAATK